MRILIEPSDYSLLNVGDVAMMDVAINRLTALWPNATIQILTDTPELLPTSSPNVGWLPTISRQRWIEDGYLSLNFLPWDPGKLLGVPRFEKCLRRSRPEVVLRLKQLRSKLRGRNLFNLNSYLAEVQAADLVVVTGMGGITDVFADFAFQLLGSVHLAIRLGKITAMFGQGLGPIQNPELRAYAGRVLSRVNLIALRESRAGVPLLDALGVVADRIVTTGDDAIEIAFNRRVTRFGDGLGVNLRCAGYSGIGLPQIDLLRDALLAAARVCNAQIVPVPTSRHPSEKDSSTLRMLFPVSDVASDYGDSLNSPQKVIEQIQRCRIVITGSYHAAVFSLAQGIPVICLVNSTYFADKFLGLLAQFNGGGEVISLETSEARAALSDCAARIWQSAEMMRPQLLISAKKQIESGRAAYQRLHDTICSRERALDAGLQ